MVLPAGPCVTRRCNQVIKGKVSALTPYLVHVAAVTEAYSALDASISKSASGSSAGAYASQKRYQYVDAA